MLASICAERVLADRRDCKVCLANPTPLLTSNWPRPRRLESGDVVEGFDCGRTELDDWLDRFALTNQQSGMTNVFVCEINGEIGAYYALSAGQVRHDSAPARCSYSSITPRG